MANSTNNVNISLLDASKFKINTQHFSAHDLSLFVDSLETLTRLKREKEARKEQKRLANLLKQNKKFSTLSHTSSTDSSFTTGDEADQDLGNENVLNTTKRPCCDSDETYFSAASSAHSSPCNSVIYRQQMRKKGNTLSTYSVATASDSEESGVYPTSSPQQESRSKVVTKSNKSPTSRLMSMVRKKENTKQPSVELISCRPLDEYETLKMHEREQQKMLEVVLVKETEKLARFSTLHMKKKSRKGFACADGSSEERFLQKALRYLTL